MSTLMAQLLPKLITQSQARKDLASNELDIILAAYRQVLSASETDPPASPGTGDAYIIAATATGVWAGHEDEITYWFDGAWRFLPAVENLIIGVVAAGAYMEYAADGSPAGWGVLGIGTGISTFTGLSDTPGSYSGQAGKGVRVNGGGTGLEFYDREESIEIACSDETTALTAGTAKVTLHWPVTGTVEEIWAGLTTPQSSGNVVTVDVNNNGSTMLSTKVTIDNTEETSLTAATPPVLTNTAVTKGQKATVDIDQVGDGTAKGLKVYVRVRRP